jgi:hypothetical protein
MAYKEKECPTCGEIHYKRGPYCSRSCGNSRIHSEEHKQLLSIKQSQYMNSGNDAAERVTYNLNHDEYDEPVMPGKETPLRRGQFIAGGDLWTLDDS